MTSPVVEFLLQELLRQTCIDHYNKKWKLLQEMMENIDMGWLDFVRVYAGECKVQSSVSQPL